MQDEGGGGGRRVGAAVRWMEGSSIVLQNTAVPVAPTVNTRRHACFCQVPGDIFSVYRYTVVSWQYDCVYGVRYHLHVRRFVWYRRCALSLIEHILLGFIGGSSRNVEAVQPRQHLVPPGPNGVGTHIVLVPHLAGVLPHPLQHLQLPGVSGKHAHE